MKPCPPPNGSLLPEGHRPFLVRTFQTIFDKQFQKTEIDPLLPEMVSEMAPLCATEGDFGAWHDELRQWVRWYRLPAYWLTFIYHLAAREKSSPYFFLGCDLYADAQVTMASDFAMSAVENAYVAWKTNQAAFGPGIGVIGQYLEQKLSLYHRYYSQWARPFDYMECNPLSEHLYFELTRQWLSEETSGDVSNFSVHDEAGLKTVIAAAKMDDLAYYRIVAQRFLGLVYDGKGRPDLSLEQYGPALNDALRLHLDTEIGHLRRLMGMTLRTLGKGPEAEEQFRKAVMFEKAGPMAYFMQYWQALSARELGDTILRFSGTEAAGAAGPGETAIANFDLVKMKAALDAYRYGRQRFDVHLTLQSPFPLARAAKHQMFRPFSNNAMQAACMLRETMDMLAEMEQSGPRQATEVVTEIGAARAMGDVPLAEFRSARSVYYQTLSTLPATFEEYLASVEQYSSMRRKYQQESIALSGKLIAELSSDAIVEKMQSLRVKDTAFLAFHVGAQRSFAVLIDGNSGQAAPFDAPFGEAAMATVHEEFGNTVARAGGDEKIMQAALGTLLERYEEMVGPLIEPVLRFMGGMHLKILPRLQMNSVPLHALRFGGKYLLEHVSTVSYGQTLGMFLENHAGESAKAPSGSASGSASDSPAGSRTDQAAALRIVIGENVPLYELSLPRVKTLYGSECLDERADSWAKLAALIAAQPARNTMFACHGHYDPANRDGSNLMLANGKDGAVRFSKLFAELDLRGCRSVIMGACESGLARAGIGAEYIGLPSAMLASGARYVVGALWTIPQLATAVLTMRFLDALKDESADVCVVLCEVQRGMMKMTRDELAAWFRGLLPPGKDLDDVLTAVSAMDATPFSHPYHWAGLEAVGDV